MGYMKSIAYRPSGSRINRFSASFEVKEQFFDRAKVERAMEASTDKAMPRSAARIHLIAQRSMKYVAPGSALRSAPGEPPRARQPRPWVRKFNFYYYDDADMSAVIGPIRLPNSTDAPHTLEFGGHRRHKNMRRRVRSIGGVGEIRLGGRRSATTKSLKDWHGKRQHVTYARLHSGKQAARANDINEALYGPEVIEGELAARPFMGPALAREVPRMTGLWENSIRGD